MLCWVAYECEFEKRIPPNIPLPTLLYKTMQKPKSTNVNPSNIARNRTASTLELPNNLRRAPCKMLGFCTPNVGPPGAVQYVNHNARATSMVTARSPLVQNSKTPEPHTILPPDPTTPRAKPSSPPHPRAAQNNLQFALFHKASRQLGG